MSRRIKHDRVKFAINHVANTVSVSNSLRSDIDTDLQSLVGFSSVYPDENAAYERFFWPCHDFVPFENNVTPHPGELFHSEDAIVLVLHEELMILAKISCQESDICDRSDIADRVGHYGLSNERSKFRTKLDLRSDRVI